MYTYISNIKGELATTELCLHCNLTMAHITPVATRQRKTRAVYSTASMANLMSKLSHAVSLCPYCISMCKRISNIFLPLWSAVNCVCDMVVTSLRKIFSDKEIVSLEPISTADNVMYDCSLICDM